MITLMLSTFIPKLTQIRCCFLVDPKTTYESKLYRKTEKIFSYYFDYEWTISNFCGMTLQFYLKYDRLVSQKTR